MVRIKGEPFPTIESKFDCSYYGQYDKCLDEHALKNDFPCKRCKIIKECKELQLIDYPYIRATYGFVVTCFKENELEVIEAMIAINKYIERKFKKIPACEVKLGMGDTMEYVKSDKDE